MTVDIQTIDQVKTVSKPWGQEKWIQAGNHRFPFVLKELTLNAGQRTSLQVHRMKSESIYILKGSGYLLYHPDFFYCDWYERGEYTAEQMERIFNGMIRFPLEPGVVFHTPPGTIHRMVAETDLIYVEASTTELDDVVRLQDDNNRTHGRIDSEHK